MPRPSSTPLHSVGEESYREESLHYALSRRRIFQRVILTSAPSLVPLILSSRNARAEDQPTQAEHQQGLLTTNDVADLLRPIPTFTIVDEKGVPFTVVGEDAKVTGYFFTTYGEANRVLNLARMSADRAIARARREGEAAEDIGMNPWTKARVSTVPLDSAVTLVSKSGRRAGGGIYFKLAPAETDVTDALAITGDDDLAEGKVPLFYFEDFTIRKTEDGSERSPLYFRRKELEQDFRRLNPGAELPMVQVSEIFAVLTELVKPGGTDNELRKLAFIAPRESEKKRVECLKRGGTQPAFVIGQRIIVL
jgi:hypothetical protein